jgi:hypothetical protein
MPLHPKDAAKTLQGFWKNFVIRCNFLATFADLLVFPWFCDIVGLGRCLADIKTNHMITDAINNPQNYEVLYAVEDFILFNKHDKTVYILSQDELEMFIQAQINNGINPSLTNT